jgi:hypothetical protein
MISSRGSLRWLSYFQVGSVPSETACAPNRGKTNFPEQESMYWLCSLENKDYSAL